jgi:hypothetical protein
MVNNCGICSVSGHNRRNCLWERERLLRIHNEDPWSPEESVAFREYQQRLFDNSPRGVYESERRVRVAAAVAAVAVGRSQEVRAAERRDAARQVEETGAVRRRPAAAGGGPAPVDDSFRQIALWARRAERSMEARLAETLPAPKTLTLKMVDSFTDYSLYDECAICYDNNPNIGLPCKHTFCFVCTKRFAQAHTNCPLCRQEFNEIHLCRDIKTDEFNSIVAKILL